jgi:SGNH hydrolase-like domain, acetyltransferase AlgX
MRLPPTRRLLGLLLVAWGLTLLSAPLALFLTGHRPLNFENRTLAEAPDLRAGNVLDLDTWKAVDAAIQDRLAFRRRAVRLRARVAYDVFGDSPRPEVVFAGADGWLFLRSELGGCEPHGPTVRPADVRAALAFAAAATRAAHIPFTSTVVPSKPYIERDHVDRSWLTQTCMLTREDALRRLLPGTPGYSDLYPAFEREKAAGGDVWMKTDTHVAAVGRVALTRVLVRGLDPPAWRDDWMRSDLRRDFVGDLTQLMGLPFASSEPEDAVTRPPGAARVRGLTVLIGDSQLWNTLEVSSVFFARPSECVWGPFLGFGCYGALVEADRIGLEVVERDIWTYVDQGFPLQLVDALLGRIDATDATWTGAQTDARGSVPATPGATLGISAARDEPGRERMLRVRLSTPATAGPVAVQVVGADGLALAPRSLGARELISDGEVAFLVPAGVPLTDVRVVVAGAAGTLARPRISVIPPP